MYLSLYAKNPHPALIFCSCILSCSCSQLFTFYLIPHQGHIFNMPVLSSNAGIFPLLQKEEERKESNELCSCKFLPDMFFSSVLLLATKCIFPLPNNLAAGPNLVHFLLQCSALGYSCTPTDVESFLG